MRICIFGLGSIGKRHACNLIEMGGHDLVGVDPAVDSFPQVAMIESTEFLESWQPEVALICTPPSDHGRWILWALEQKCHVFAEKPVCPWGWQATQLRDYALQKGRMLAVGYQLRWSMDEFRSQAYGQDARFTIGQDMSTWPSQYPKDILEEFSHEIDAAVFVNGPVDAVVASVHGSVWHLQLRHLRAYSDVLIMAGSSAPPVRFASVANGKIGWQFDLEENDQAYKDELTAFLNACQGELLDYRLCSGAEAAHVVQIIDAARLSAKECRVVKI